MKESSSGPPDLKTVLIEEMEGRPAHSLQKYLMTHSSCRFESFCTLGFKILRYALSLCFSIFLFLVLISLLQVLISMFSYLYFCSGVNIFLYVMVLINIFMFMVLICFFMFLILIYLC